MKIRNSVVVFVVIVAAAVGITDESGMLIITSGNNLISPLSALKEYRGKRGIGKNPWFSFRILLTFSATVSYLDLIFLCSSHTYSLDSRLC